MKLRTYTIIHSSCRCGSGTIARSTVRWMYGPRCPGCGKTLGPMDWKCLGKVRAEGEFSALETYRKEKLKG